MDSFKTNTKDNSGPISNPGGKGMGTDEEMEEVMEDDDKSNPAKAEFMNPGKDFKTDTVGNKGPVSNPDGNGDGQYEPREERNDGTEGHPDMDRFGRDHA